jgi:hypothetical protein
MKWLKRLLILGGMLFVIAGGVMLVPGIRDRVLWHGNNLYIQIRYMLFPPEKLVFVPQAEAGVELPATPTLPIPTATAQPSSTPALDQPTATSEPTSTPLPAMAQITGVKYFDQHGLYNYCAPANLAMALSFWGWGGDRTDVGNSVKPYEKDKNVMPYELADYVGTNTDLHVVMRSGGTEEILKGLVAGGFPVLVERGDYIKDLTGKISWMGHYQVVTGYDDGAQRYITQDSFYQADYPVPYAEMVEGWRAFNYVFLVVYPAEKEADLIRLLGPLADETKAFRAALDIASAEIYTTAGNDQFFAWFNRGTSLVNLQDFSGAADAFDQAFRLYPDLPVDRRPWRMLWYQTGPYFAYYYTARYGDVESLATQTIDGASEPYLEESWYWRARAREMTGDQQGAVEDLRQSLVYHPDFSPSLAALQNMGVTP